MHKTRRGFTLVELLIVIVMIAILAAISIVAYNGVQERTRDSQRLQDMATITKALQLYKIANEHYPAPSQDGSGLSNSSWEISSLESAGMFIAPLKSVGLTDGAPVDPVNNATTNDPRADRTNNRHSYYYHLYPAGHGGCDASRGRFFVLGFNRSETTGGARHPDSPGFACSTRNWQSEFSWVTGSYEN